MLSVSLIAVCEPPYRWRVSCLSHWIDSVVVSMYSWFVNTVYSRAMVTSVHLQHHCLWSRDRRLPVRVLRPLLLATDLDHFDVNVLPHSHWSSADHTNWWITALAFIANLGWIVLLLRCAFHFCCKLLMVFVGVSKFGNTDLIFVDPGVKINGTYYHDVLLTEQLLPVVYQISGEFFYLPARQCSGIVSTQDSQSSGTGACFHLIRLVGPNSPYLNPVDYRIWGEMQHSGSTRWKWWTEIAYVCCGLKQNLINEAVNECSKNLCACIRAKGEHLIAGGTVLTAIMLSYGKWRNSTPSRRIKTPSLVDMKLWTYDYVREICPQIYFCKNLCNGGF